MNILIALIAVVIGIQIGLAIQRTGFALFCSRWWVCFDGRSKEVWIDRTNWALPPLAIVLDKSMKVGVIGPYGSADKANEQCDRIYRNQVKFARRKQAAA
jgi:hypothetical protein